MPKSPNSDAAPLTLYPPRLPRATDLGGGRFGIPKHIYDLEPMGLRVEVLPYIDQEPNDDVRLNLNDQPNIDSKQTQSTDDTVILHVPKAMLLPDIVNRLTYTVFRASNNRGTSGPPAELIYNRVRPGNEDRFPDIDGHSELELLLPDAIKNGVGPDFPVAGVPVCVSYPYCRAHDLIRLNLNGYDKFHTVTEQQAPLPGSDTPVQVCFNVTRADLAQGGDNARYSISYTVTDQLSNGADPDSPWSASQVVDVDLAGNRLPPPLLRERLNDPGDDTTIIDLEKLAGNPLLIVVAPIPPRFQKDDRVDAVYTLRRSGEVDIRVERDGIIDEDEFGIPRPCVLQVPNDQVLSGGAVSVSFTLSRGGAVIANSRTANATVIGQGAIDLTPPLLVAPAVSPIDVLAYPTGVRVRVEHLSSASGDSAQLVESDPPPGSPAFPIVPLNANHRADFTLTQAFLSERQGRNSELRWILLRAGRQVGESTLLTLAVNRIADGDDRLPTPAITAVTDDAILDLTSFSGDTSVLVGSWPGIAMGQRIWMRCLGTNKSGAPAELVIYQGQSISSTNEQYGEVTRAYLDQLANGSTIEVIVSVNYYGQPDEASSTKFPGKNYTIRALSELIVDTTKVELNGVNLFAAASLRWRLSGTDPAGTAVTRTATGGVPPYSYSSQNRGIASVDDQGVIRSTGNGETKISISDSAGQTKSIDVSTSNVTEILYSGGSLTMTGADSFIEREGAKLSGNDFTVITMKYLPPSLNDFNYHCGRNGTSNQYIVLRYLSTGNIGWHILSYVDFPSAPAIYKPK